MTPQLRQAARQYAAEYSGDFSFMVEMRAQVIGGNFLLSDGQAKGVLNVLMADARRRIEQRASKVHEPEVITHKYLANVPDGRYRVTLVDGDHLAVRIALAGKDSKLAGARIVSTRSGGDEWMGVAHISSNGSFKVWRSAHGALGDRVSNAIEILDQAKDQDGWLIHGLAFAQHGRQCFYCGRDLDTPESLAVGYGPVCAAHLGLPWGAKAIPMAVRLAQAEAAQAASTEAAPAEKIDLMLDIEDDDQDLPPVAQAEPPKSAPKENTPTAGRIVMDRLSKLVRNPGESDKSFNARKYAAIFGEDN